MVYNELSIPSHFEAGKVDQVWKVPYQARAEEAKKWAKEHTLSSAGQDTLKICLVLIDVQNTFCLPDFELYVAGRSGRGAVDDNRRLCEFIYRNLGLLTQICPTLDTHQAMQIFHSVFLVNEVGEHPAPFTLISKADLEQGIWKFNPELSESLQIDTAYAQDYLLHYAQQLKEGDKYDLTIWPYHAMLGGIGHALVSSIEEAVFFHGIARHSQPNFQLKGAQHLTENYSALSPEVLENHVGQAVGHKNTEFIKILMAFDVVIIAGQAKSHCVASTIEDLLTEIVATDAKLAETVYLLEDCTSPVVIPGVVDYTDQADAAFQRFAEAGMHVVRSTDPIAGWPGINRD